MWGLWTCECSIHLTSPLLSPPLLPPPLPSSPLLSPPLLLPPLSCFLVVLSLLYVIMETVGRETEAEPDHWKQLRTTFLAELEFPCRGGEETLTSTLFSMLLFFCNGTMPHYPIKKVLLLLWKCVMTIMGGLGALQETKKANRVEAGLPPDFPEDTPTKPLILPMPNYDPRCVGVAWCDGLC